MQKQYQNNNEYLVVDFHTHTHYSTDSLTSPEKLIETARKKRLDRVAITDHNSIKGAQIAKKMDPALIIVGCELETTEGEILAFFVSEPVQPGLQPNEAIDKLRKQNAFISISHPFDPTRKGSWRLDALINIVPLIDAVETFNARCLFPWHNWNAEKFASKHNLLGTHGSDAHAPFEIGRGSLLVPAFNDPVSLKTSLSIAISPRLTLSPAWVHLSSRYATWKKKSNKSS
jgi:predicted metal-dependent phosphoesterase TrpH